VLYNLLEGIRIGSVLIEPFMPDTAKNVFAQINTKQTDYDSIQSWGSYEVSNTVTAQPQPLFARIDAAKKLEEIHAYLDEKYAVKKMEFKEEVTIDDFARMDLRVGTVLKCEKHPKADKLLVFQIRVGTETRQIVSGIAKWYKPEDLVGRKVAFIANLKPVVLRGVESQGMLLSAEGADGTLELVTLSEVEDGASIH
ncbi:MAG: methionine--tRNA ligase subunit beta, partial [Erysipelotrichaceae bacterium]|nr:methionine--tRNA ligase subunit beta [Erysipelotrichaceae bacterium]